MWNISVEPMPSMISMPVASFHSLRVTAGSASPADTHFAERRQVVLLHVGGHRAIRRRRGDEHRRLVLRDRRQQRVRRRPLDQQRRRADPQRKQQQSAQPERERERRAPGEDVVGVARSIAGGQQSQAAIRSRWKCIVPLGLPVVPEVNAISAVSSAAVSTAANVAGLVAIRASRPSAAVPAEVDDRRQRRALCGRAASSSSREPRVAERVRDLGLGDDVGQLLRAEQRHRPTAMPPALSTANKHAAYIGLFGARSSTRLPGTSPRSSTRTRAMRFAWASSSAYVQRRPPGARIAGRSPSPRSRAPSRSCDGGVQALRIAELRQLEDELGPLLARRQVVARERVDVRGPGHDEPPSVAASTSRPTISFCTSVAPS